MKSLKQLRYCYSTDYKLLRVYKNHSALQLLNALMVNRAAATPWLVSNSMRLYNQSKKITGTNITNSVVESTFGRVFTAGKSISEVNDMSKDLRKVGIRIMAGYCGEGFIEGKAHEPELDTNTEMYRLCAEETSKYPNQIISMKISGLVDMTTLRKIDAGVEKRNRFWDQNSKNSVMTGTNILSGFQKIDSTVNQNDIRTFLKLIFEYEGTISDFKCDEVDFKMNVYPYYIDNNNKTTNKLITKLCPLSPEQLTIANSMNRRINKIFSPFSENKNNFKIMIDAEQSYIQRAIFTISEQYQRKYNKDRPYIVPTLQNYLVQAPERLKYELEFAKRNNLVFSFKFVRGAYLVQQRRIAAENKTPCAVVDSFDKTTVNFLGNVESYLKTEVKPGSNLIVASHNRQTLEQVKKIKQTYNNPNAEIEFAQLIGLADHLTMQLVQQGYSVYKSLAYGPTSTMVPYLIRRAQELSQMNYPLKLQHDLIIHEFKHRVGLTS